MHLGSIQKAIVRKLYEHGDTGVYFPAVLNGRLLPFAGLDRSQVDLALHGLANRKIISRHGLAWKLQPWVYKKYSPDEIMELTEPGTKAERSHIPDV